MVKVNKIALTDLHLTTEGLDSLPPDSVESGPNHCETGEGDSKHFTFMHLADAFIQSDLQCIQAIHVLSVCVPWELNPQPLRC